MKAAPFTYHAPSTVAETLGLLTTLDNPRLLAGGQSLMPMLAYRLATPDHLIDLGGLTDLREITMRDGWMAVGSMVTQRRLELAPEVKRHSPLLVEALAHVGHQTTRNRGTIGGSLCHLDPSAELPLVSLVLDPMLSVAGRRGVRTLPYREFPVTQLVNQLEPDEILTEVAFPPLPPGTSCAFQEFARRPGDFAIVAVALCITRAADDKVDSARLAVAGIGPVAVRLPEVEHFLVEEGWGAAQIERAAALAATQPADGDAGNPADYRQHLVGVLTRRALQAVDAKVPRDA
jgi:carbon-monoxide dehydrogenase medium subunit